MICPYCTSKLRLTEICDAFLWKCPRCGVVTRWISEADLHKTAKDIIKEMSVVYDTLYYDELMSEGDWDNEWDGG